MSWHFSGDISILLGLSSSPANVSASTTVSYCVLGYSSDLLFSFSQTFFGAELSWGIIPGGAIRHDGGLCDLLAA